MKLFVTAITVAMVMVRMALCDFNQQNKQKIS